ncbi:MAG TPA: glycosyltransferase [Gemmatimonadaceae bacterium]|jgi:cellulose synthase/poly-beta-1,6-N-acetylglucosamine synthase-like glycosyltransferase
MVATWLLYPAAIGLGAWVSRLRRSCGDFKRSVTRVPVSLILATRDDVDAVRARVADLLRTAYDPLMIEVVVGIDAAAARPFDVASLGNFETEIIVVTGDAPGGKAATLNAAVRASHGELLVFADTSQRFSQQTIPELLAALTDPSVGAVSGSLELPSEGGELTRRYWRYERWLREREARLHSSVGVTGAVYAMRRALWQPLPVGLLLDDVFTPMRLVLAGHRIAFARSARAFEQRVINDSREYSRKVRTQTGVIQLCAWMPALLLPWRNPIWVQFVFHKLLRLLTPYCALLFAASGLTAALRVLGTLNGPWIIAVLAAVGVLLLPIRRRGGAMREVFLLQMAVVVASVNGLRGRWEVWSR